MNKFMKIAVDEAKKGVTNGDGGPFGALVVKNGKIIAKAHNSVVKTNDPTAHAEINAIRKAAKKLNSFDLSGCEVYTTCMPCPMCMGAIRWANINIIYYGATSKDAQDIGFRDKEFYDEEFINIYKIDTKESLEPFRLWQDKEDKVIY